MNKKNIAPETIALQKRFFEVLNILIERQQIDSVNQFCEDYKLNRVKYQVLRRTTMNPAGQGSTLQYKLIDIQAIIYLCRDFGASSEYLVVGKGKKFK